MTTKEIATLAKFLDICTELDRHLRSFNMLLTTLLRETHKEDG